jgi:hypothetical protein
VSKDTFVAAAALYETLFTKTTIGERDENSTSVLVDTMAAFDKGLEKEWVEGDRVGSNIIATVDLINMVGWKYHES